MYDQGLSREIAPQAKADVEALAFDKEVILKPYQPLRRMLEQPVEIDPILWALCRSPFPEEEAAFRKADAGPHSKTMGMYYMNDSAAQVYRDKGATYPVGAVIVKEKLHSMHADESKTQGLAGMVKRAAGYDPEHGNWEYFFVDDVSPLRRGPIPSCVSCHTKVAAKDYVFGDWKK